MNFSKIRDAKKQPAQAYRRDKFDQSSEILLNLKKPLSAHSETVVSSQATTRQDGSTKAFSFGVEMKTLICPNCKNSFQTKQHNQKYCSQKCKWTFTNKNRVIKPNQIFDCIVCGKRVEIYIAPSSIKKGRAKAMFCSLQCKGIAQKGENHWNWQGGRILEADGYVIVHAPEHPNAKNTGYVFEHRLVMEKHLGRYLDRKEVVHRKRSNYRGKTLWLIFNYFTRIVLQVSLIA